MKTRLLSLPLLLMLAASLAACGGGQNVPASAVAVVDGKPITTHDYNAYFAQSVAAYKQQYGTAPTGGSTQMATLRNQTVAYLVLYAELEQQAQKENLSVTQHDVTAFLATYAQTHFGGSMQKLTAALRKQGISMPAARQEVYGNLIAQKIHTKVTSSAKVTTAEEQAYFQAHPPAETRSVEHILVKSKSLADSIEQRLKNGTSFATLAKQYSKDPSSAAQGGKFTATKGNEVPAYDDAAFALKTGALSAPVDATTAANGSYGWFIIKALAPVHTTTFSEEEPTIHQTLLQQAQDTLWQKWIADLAKQYKGKVSYQSGYAPPTTTAISTSQAVTTG